MSEKLTDVMTCDVGFEDHFAYALWHNGVPFIHGRFDAIGSGNRLMNTVVAYKRKLNVSFPSMYVVKIKKVILEGIEFWVTPRGIAGRGDAVQIAYLVGALIYVTLESGIECKVVDAKEWRGQLTNKALNAVIERHYGFKPVEHVREAIGIGMNEMGLLHERFRRNSKM